MNTSNLQKILYKIEKKICVKSENVNRHKCMGIIREQIRGKNKKNNRFYYGFSMSLNNNINYV